MSRKNYFFILLLICLILPLSVSYPAFGFDSQDKDIDLCIQSFEKAYSFFKNEGIFFKDHRTALRGVVWMLPAFSKKPLVLTNDEQANLCMVTDYVKKLLIENPSEREKIIKLSIRGLFSLTDKYGGFIDAGTFQTMMCDKMIGNYEGDGAGIVFQDNKALILYVFSNTPAQKVGIKAGDEIIKINGVNFCDLKDDNDLDERIKQVGKSFKPDEPLVYLYEIKRGDKILKFKTTTIKIEKEKIVFYRQEGDIGIIEVKHFSYGCGMQFLEALDNLTACGIKGLIINLRNNPGGAVNEASIILKLITGKGLKIESANGQEKNWESTKVERHTFSGPVVVLVNLWTASSAEVVASCLQEDGNMVIGEKTFGKNYAQTFKILPNSDYIRFSVYWMKTPNGNSWPDGVYPDIRVSAIKIDQSMEKAIEILKEKMKETGISDSYILLHTPLDLHNYFAKRRLFDSNKLIKVRELNLF